MLSRVPILTYIHSTVYITGISDINFSCCGVFLIIDGSYVEIDGCHVEETNELEEQNDEYSVDCMDIGDAVQCTDALWDTAYFLLRVTQEQSLTYSGIENFCDAMQDYKEMICSKISDQIGNNLKRYQGCVIDEINSKDILSAVEIDDNFSIFKSRYSREMYYEKHFNYNVQCNNLV